jgi:hypothetical protein
VSPWPQGWKFESIPGRNQQGVSSATSGIPVKRLFHAAIDFWIEASWRNRLRENFTLGACFSRTANFLVRQNPNKSDGILLVCGMLERRHQ